jgi:hypothetical protein
MAYKPKDGLVFNPLLKYPRNIPCFCGSALKAKRCCIPKLKRAIPLERLEELKAYMDHVDAMREGLSHARKRDV